jgi:uncharacterized protein
MRFFISYLFIILALSLSCCGQQDKKTGQKKVTGTDLVIPEKPIGRVSDFERIFTPVQVYYLDSIIASHEKITSNEIAVVSYALDSTRIKTADDFDKFSFLLFNQWGIGTKDKNNGVGILISENLRKIRIEVGKGLQTKLTDQEAKAIIDTIIVPEFKMGAYFTGISKGLDAIIREIQ